MTNVYCFTIWFIANVIIETKSNEIEDKVKNYFESDIVHNFQNQWMNHKHSVENAIMLAMKENYGHKGMNVYIRQLQDPHLISKGYYHTDGQVHLILTDLELGDLPYLWMPEFKLLLPSNTIQVDASLSKMILNTNYLLFRNKSDIIYELKDQNQFENSPFTFQQVRSTGQLSIVIEGCILSGTFISTLNGQSVNLGHSSFKLSKCQYTLEIFKPGVGSPPVIARYLPNGSGLSIEHLLIRPLRDELLPKLQASLFTCVNTSAIFGDNLQKIRQHQEAIFQDTSCYMNNVVNNLNKKTVELNLGTIEMDDFKIYWNDSFEETPINDVVHLNKVVLTGLETAYSSHTGGPNKYTMAIHEQIRFSSLQVRGDVILTAGKKAISHFAVEINDVAVNVIIHMFTAKDRKQAEKSSGPVFKLEVVGWRAFEISVPGVELISIESIITGYLLNAIPKYLVTHLYEVFDDAIEETNGRGENSVTGVKPDRSDITSDEVHGVNEVEKETTSNEITSYEFTSGEVSLDSNQGEPVILIPKDNQSSTSMESDIWLNKDNPDIKDKLMDTEKHNLPSDETHTDYNGQGELSTDVDSAVRVGKINTSVAKSTSNKTKHKVLKVSTKLSRLSDNEIHSD